MADDFVIVNPLGAAKLAAEDLKSRMHLDRDPFNPMPKTAVILGSGLSEAADRFDTFVCEVPVHHVSGFNTTSVDGHGTMIRLMTIGNESVIIMPRTHPYEAHINIAMHPVRTAAALGCERILIASACGGANPFWEEKDVVVIMDHVNRSGITPFTGPVFLNQDAVYDPDLWGLAFQVDPKLLRGIHMQVHGPEIESPAEVREFRMIAEHPEAHSFYTDSRK